MAPALSDTIPYFSISSAPYGSGTWLLLNADDTFSTLAGALDRGPLGRQPNPPIKIPLRAELEGASRDYSRDEIEASRRGAPLPYEQEAMSGAIVAVDAFVAAVEAEGAVFRARALTLEHGKTKRTFPDYWIVRFCDRPKLGLLRDDSRPVIVGDTTLYAARVRERIDALGWNWLAFQRHDLPRCNAVSLGEGAQHDKTLMTALGAACVKRRLGIGDAYDSEDFIDTLQVRYTDASAERVARIIERGGTSFFIRRDDAGKLDSIGVQPGSTVAKMLKKK